MGKLLKKEDMTRFLYKLKQKGELIAPQGDDARLEVITDLKGINLSKIPPFSVKKYFMPNEENLFSYDNNKIFNGEKPISRVLFGIRLCELNALLRMDKLFLDAKNPDTIYKKRRDNSILIGYNCTKPEANCFCESMDLENYYDLFFYEMGDYYYIDIGSEKGHKLVSRLNDYDYTQTKIKCIKKLNKKLTVSQYENNAWDKLVKNCLSCGRCNAVCPTCYCFNVRDKNELSGIGMRIREWDSCQFKDFTTVAGGFVFRDTRMERLRHRIFHKLLYFRQRFSKDMCVGCGKCITHCPTNIDFVEAINKIK